MGCSCGINIYSTQTPVGINSTGQPCYFNSNLENIMLFNQESVKGTIHNLISFSTLYN